MNFCTKCGYKLESEQETCPQCGYDLSSRKNNEKNISNTLPINELSLKNKLTTTLNPRKNKFSLSLKAKVGILCISLSVMLLFILFIIGNSLSKPLKVVEKFEKSVASNDKTELINVFYCNDSRLKVNEKSLAPLLTYFKDNPSYLNTVLQDLNNDAIKLEESKNLVANNSNRSQYILSLVYTGKKFLFFPSYKISIKPSFIQIHTKLKDVTFSLNDEDIGKSDTDNYTKEFGPFIPGKLKIVGNYKGKFSSFNDSKDIDVISNNIKNDNIKTSIDILTKLNYIEIKSNYPEAEIFVNNKDTETKISNAENFGPLDINSKIYATVTKDGKTLKSNEYIVSEGFNYVYINFDNAENVTKENKADNGSHNYIKWDSVSASSTLAQSSQGSYDPNNVNDWDNNTAWVEGDAGDGINSWILLKNNTPQSIKGIEISNGYKKSKELFLANNRAKKVKVEFSDGSSIIQELKDGYDNNNIISLDKAVTTSFIKITILEVYKGSQYSDTAITGIHAF